ncbi:hypothetical protein [Couchioplanes caeruleus]|uniref:Uncharacterized protein n=1 Tax=Couchioplanes caeruleus subsp. caeruleus TaxID=56427 RepID=A0A1K0FH20_9ACTN|nr:hypothetical protein [Couchioplanes caeruleus]OJF12137.1 hypothetical protein BG844_22255 [Couchioplanes caeruleus subsp. caeruleus]
MARHSTSAHLSASRRQCAGERHQRDLGAVVDPGAGGAGGVLGPAGVRLDHADQGVGQARGDPFGADPAGGRFAQVVGT